MFKIYNFSINCEDCRINNLLRWPRGMSLICVKFGLQSAYVFLNNPCPVVFTICLPPWLSDLGNRNIPNNYAKVTCVMAVGRPKVGHNFDLLSTERLGPFGRSFLKNSNPKNIHIIEHTKNEVLHFFSLSLSVSSFFLCHGRSLVPIRFAAIQ